MAESFSCKIKNKTRNFTLPLLFNITLEVLARAIKKEKEIKAPKLETKKDNYFYSQMI